MRQRVRRAAVTSYRAAHRALSSVIDRIVNVDTTDEVDLADLGLDAPNRNRYQPSNWWALRRILRPADVSSEDVFLDFGSGKGRVVLLAARYPFKRVVGVELSERLTEIARRNVKDCQVALRCGDVVMVNADALDYDLPDDVNVVFIQNSFRGPIFDAVIERLMASVDRHPRTVRLIYSNTMEHDRLMRTGRFTVVRVSRALRPTREWRDATAFRLYVLEPRARGRRCRAQRAMSAAVTRLVS